MPLLSPPTGAIVAATGQRRRATLHLRCRHVISFDTAMPHSAYACAIFYRRAHAVFAAPLDFASAQREYAAAPLLILHRLQFRRHRCHVPLLMGCHGCPPSANAAPASDIDAD